MNNAAHIAFDRHMKDLDVTIIRVKTTLQKNMDMADLADKIKEHGLNIAAIIISAPNYPFGVTDDILKAAQIALEASMPLHVDGCLGAGVMQFIKNNPAAIDFNDKRFEGITSWSADLIKIYTHKGLSFLGYKNGTFKYPPREICKQRSSTHLEVGLACMLYLAKLGMKNAPDTSSIWPNVY